MLCYLSKPAMRSLAAALSCRTCSSYQSRCPVRPAASIDYHTYCTYLKQSFQLLPEKRGILCLTVRNIVQRILVLVMASATARSDLPCGKKIVCKIGKDMQELLFMIVEMLVFLTVCLCAAAFPC